MFNDLINKLIRTNCSHNLERCVVTNMTRDRLGLHLEGGEHLALHLVPLLHLVEVGVGRLQLSLRHQVRVAGLSSLKHKVLRDLRGISA